MTVHDLCLTHRTRPTCAGTVILRPPVREDWCTTIGALVTHPSVLPAVLCGESAALSGECRTNRRPWV